MVRYNKNGVLDRTFGNGGKVRTDFARESDGIGAIAIRPDGRIIAAGGAQNAAGGDTALDFALARYQRNGKLDPTFGRGGKVGTDFLSKAFTSLNDAIADIAIQRDGKIVAVGGTERPEANRDDFDFAVARYNSNGTLDPTFGTGGKVVTDFAKKDDQAGSVMIQPDGKIIVGGMTGGRITYAFDRIAIFDTHQLPNSTGTNLALVRYLPNGKIDTSFGKGGKVVTDFFRSTDSAKFVLQPTGTILAAGWTRRTKNPSIFASDYDFALARYLTK